MLRNFFHHSQYLESRPNLTTVISEVDEILDHKDPERRAEIARQLGKKLDIKLTDLERKIAENVARKLVGDTVLMVRKALANSVRHSCFLPKDIGLKLAYDVDDVAAPFLEVTQIFSEDELCVIAREVGLRCKCAIAGREDLPSAIALALSESGCLEVAKTLVANATSQLRADALLTLIDNFDGETELFEAMTQRISMPPQVAHLLISRVGEATATKLKKAYNLSSDFANPVIEESKLSSLIEFAESASPLDLMVLVRKLRDGDKLTPATLISALRAGSLSFFEAAIALLAGISLNDAQKTLGTLDATQIHELCNKAMIPPSMWAEMATTAIDLIGISGGRAAREALGKTPGEDTGKAESETVEESTETAKSVA